jgi:hypothetical protein
MPIKSTTDNPETKFWNSPGPNVLNNGWLVLTLFVYACLGCAFLLLINALRGGNASNRIGFAVFMSIMPALVALAFLRLTKLLVSWPGAGTLYLLIFFLVLIIQNYGRTISIY